MDHQAKIEYDQKVIKSLTDEADASLKSLEWLDTYVKEAIAMGTSFTDDQSGQWIGTALMPAHVAIQTALRRAKKARDDREQISVRGVDIF